MADSTRVEIGLLACGVDEGSAQDGATTDRRALVCTFSPSASRPEETYLATFQGLAASGELPEGRTMIWIVLAPSMLEMAPGLLQQVYVPDTSAPLQQAAPLIGETNASILLRDITDARQPGGDGRKNDDVGYAIVLLALKLKSTPT